MKFFFRPRALACALVLAIAAALPFLATVLSGQNFFFFDITVSADVAAGAQVFYDTGKGFNEAESVYQPLHNHGTPARYRFALPTGILHALRFDPIDQPGSATFSKARIVDRYGNVIRRFTPADFRPANQIASAAVTAAGLVMRTVPGGNDPFFLIASGPPFALTPGAKNWLQATAPTFAVVFLAVLGLAALPWSRLHRLRAWAATHPRGAIAALSAFTVVVACHPVVFAGKSFVSPNNGVLLLHDQYPTMDLAAESDIEWPQFSDIGAMMWWHLYCPVITRDALFRDHELPLWNRYTMAGLPFLGQGQAMVGDPLGWLPVLARSAAWSWDLKFLLTRWLLCCGLGLTVLALTGELAGSLFVTLSAGFFAFFVFRLNHAANFSLGYSPWILLAWIQLRDAAGRRALARNCLLLLLANFAVMNSGTVKEAYMLMACVNLAGLLLLLWDSQTVRQRGTKLAWAVAAGLTFLLATAPWWRVFLAALKQSWTAYDVPMVSQLSPTQLLGFFDDLISSQLLPEERTYLPSVNFLLLLGLLWAFAARRDVTKRRGFWPLAVATLVPASLVYGLIPGAVVAQIPFIANINSVDNTFSCPLIILAAGLAGYGFSALLRALDRPTWRAEFSVVILLLVILSIVFFAANPAHELSSFFLGYAGCLLLAFLALPIGLRAAKLRHDGGLAVAVIVVGSFLLIWRNGQYLRTPFDRYVFNPKARIELRTHSAAVAFIDHQMQEPSRPIGFGLNLFAGYNQLLGWESILGVDPLRNRYYDELAAALGVERVRNAAQPTPPGQTASYVSSLDLLNVRYYLAAPEPHPPALAGLKFLRELDFGVYESPTAWPRAFFTDRVWPYETAAQLANQVKGGDRRPLAAVQTRDDPLTFPANRFSADLGSRRVVAAHDYRLTTNTTSFQIEAPAAGVVVLAENYYPDDFRVTVNGKPARYFRVNHAFKGVYLAEAGSYRIKFEYWPHVFTSSLEWAALGLLGICGFGFLAVHRNRSWTPRRNH